LTLKARNAATVRVSSKAALPKLILILHATAVHEAHDIRCVRVMSRTIRRMQMKHLP
jgi:hypothetical protein